MDIGELKKQSELSYSIAVAKRNALEKAHSRLVVVYNEHVFRADAETICLAKTLADSQDRFYVLDTNQNPVEITDPKDFIKTLIARNQESFSSYHQMSKTVTKRGD